MAPKKVAELLVDALAEAGVQRMYGAVLSGRGDEIIDLAKTNLLR